MIGQTDYRQDAERHGPFARSERRTEHQGGFTMNQIAASILILAASICGYASSIRPASDGFGSIMTLVALGLGLWGGLALLTATTLERESQLDEVYDPAIRTAKRGMNRIRSMASQYVPTVPHMSSASMETPLTTRLSPDMAAHVSAAAQAHGATRQDVVDDVLRRNLPRYSGTRVA